MPSYSPVHHTMTLDPNRLSLPISLIIPFPLNSFTFYTRAFRLDYYLTNSYYFISTSLVCHITSAQLTKQPQNKKNPSFIYDFTISHALCKYSWGFPGSQAGELPFA